jgi:hypothetical protein
MTEKTRNCGPLYERLGSALEDAIRDLSNVRLIILKAVLFLCLGVGSSILLLRDRWTIENCALLMLVIWAFCRCYYFMFYVIERYIDSSYRFSGILSVIQYLIRKSPRLPN